VVLDLHHPGRDGLRLCLAIKLQPHPPAVVIYSASNGDALVVTAASPAPARWSASRARAPAC
jgi:CheY-like chemotaxis protein